ncbi:conserved membrane protein of unknown function [Nitrospira japonica]|uniref:Transmembrane protein n=1 Tax=Nitrospira japonica TaxID=1325564 RepID=A0A1W1I733_9BACT|nr:hypothetical protein [Nitrospira japonica]SLM48848.1 conserved membrane protein of unknown function [Nitrospira japonica]
MAEIVTATVNLYRQALRKTWQSLVRGWIIMVALIGFMLILAVTTQLAGPLGIAGGFLLGAVNALLVGAVLSLIEQSISYGRTLTLRDVFDSFGRYFWDVIGVGFVLWLPLLALEMGTQTNPYGPFLSYAVLVLLFLLLNPAPEVIYQVHHDSPLDVMKTSYEFVLENWMEWFLPIAVLLIPIVLSPAGVREVFSLSSRAGRGAGLDFFQLLVLPFTILGGWLGYLGIPSAMSWYLLLLLTPPMAVAMLLFRGHLFALLSGSSRRQRRFASQHYRGE